MKKIAFTPDDLADVYAKRWMIRDMANSFIRHLKPVSYPDVTHPVFVKLGRRIEDAQRQGRLIE